MKSEKLESQNTKAMRSRKQCEQIFAMMGLATAEDRDRLSFSSLNINFSESAADARITKSAHT